MPMLTNPIKVGATTLHNRLVMPPMATEKSESQGKVGDALCAYYDEKTHGGYFGLVVAEHGYISSRGQASKGQVSFSHDSDIDGLKRLVDTIHRNGSKVLAQINHAGGKALFAVEGKETAPAPSAMPYTTTRGESVLAHAMSKAEIDDVVACFAEAARRAKEAGFDGVEIHSAHGYLLNQFYSPITNRRTDAYSGATLEGRTLLHRQVIAAVRKAVGPDYLVALRLGACDYQEGGSTREDAVWACKAFQAAGIDLLDISGGLCGYKGDGSKEEAYFAPDSAAVREEVSIPVVVTGGVRTPKAANRLIEEGSADMVGVGRAVLKDSLWASRAIHQLGGVGVKGAVFFDFDGTLHDSMAIYGPAFRKAYAWLVSEGHMPAQEFSDEWISQWLGWTTEAMWTAFAPSLPEKIWRHAAAIVGEEMDSLTEQGKARLFEGVPAMLDELKRAGYQLAFLSNCRTRYCEVHRRRFGLDTWFDAYYCAEDFGDIPKWQIYQQVAGRHVSQRVMVGDRFHDLEVAEKTGIPFIGCSYGFGTAEELESATVHVASPEEIPCAVERVFS